MVTASQGLDRRAGALCGVRRRALNRLRQQTRSKSGLKKAPQKRAGGDRDYRLRVLTNEDRRTYQARRRRGTRMDPPPTSLARPKGLEPLAFRTAT